MSFFGKLFKSKELKAFEQALKNRDFSTAIELGRSGEIPGHLVQDAKDRLAIIQAVQVYGQDAEKTIYLDQILEFTENPQVIHLVKDKTLQDKILIGRSKRAILAQDFDDAIAQAKGIQDKDLQTVALRKVAGRNWGRP